MAKKIYFRLFCLIIFCIYAISGVGFSMENDQAIPDTITIEGTKYVNCNLVVEYPFLIKEKITTVNGKAVEKMGSLSFPWLGLEVEEKLLFSAKDKMLLYNRAWIGKNLNVRGYPGTGKILMRNWYSKEIRDLQVKNAFYVTEVVGWKYAAGYSVDESIGTITSKPSFFWIKIEDQ